MRATFSKWSFFFAYGHDALKMDFITILLLKNRCLITTTHFQESSPSILRGMEDEEDDDEIGDILNDDEIDTILGDESDNER